MTVMLQVSDPHFGTERVEVVDALQRFARELRPDLLLLSGDITQRATRPQFAAARAFVDRLEVPAMVVIPGNHDIALFDLVSRLLRPYARYAEAFGSELEPRFENDEVLVLGVNTTRRYRHADGEVSAAQIDRVAHALATAQPRQWRVVVVHQPVAVTRDSDRHNLLHGRDAAVRRWADAGVDLIVGGHIHLPYVVPLRERWPELSRPVWAVQAGTAVSRRVRVDAGNSVNVIRVAGHPQLRHADAAGTAGQAPCVVERWDHNITTQRFERGALHPLHRAGGV